MNRSIRINLFQQTIAINIWVICILRATDCFLFSCGCWYAHNVEWMFEWRWIIIVFELLWPSAVSMESNGASMETFSDEEERDNATSSDQSGSDTENDENRPKIVPSNNGKRSKLMMDGFTYNFDREVEHTTYWKCTKWVYWISRREYCMCADNPIPTRHLKCSAHLHRSTHSDVSAVRCSCNVLCSTLWFSDFNKLF